MSDRIRRVITTAFVCHLLLSCLLLTSELLPAQDSPATKAAPQEPQKSEPSVFDVVGDQGEPVTISAREQEKDKDIYHLHGDVEIEYGDYTLHADDVIYNSATDD